MKRRIFLAAPLIASSILTNAQITSEELPTKGFKVGKGKGRNIEGLKVLGSTFDCKVSGKDTTGQHCIFDTLRINQGGPPLHLHHEQDEWFYIVKGEFKIQIGDETFIVKEGDSAFGPGKVPHTFAQTSEGEGQMMVLFQPAGRIEEFFTEREALENETDKEMKDEKQRTLWDRHGMKIVGPAIKI